MRILESARAVLLIFVSLGACAEAVTVAPGYRVSEIPYAAHRLQWIDDQNVLFAGTRRTNSATTNRNSKWGPQAVYRWDIRNGEVVELMEAGEGAGMLCYDRGYLYVAFNRGDERVVRHGPIRQEQEISYKKGSEPPFKGFFNPYNCRFREVPTATRPNHGVVTVLRDDHGFIEAERPSEPFPQRKYFLVRPSGERIEIGLRCGGRAPRFSAYTKAYVYQDGAGLSGPNIERRACIVGVDGSVTERKLPKGQWMRGTVYGMPVKNATLLVSLSTVAKAEGAYLVKGENVEQLVRGYISDFAVSPDGCKVAMSLQPGQFDDDAVTRNVVVNICQPRS
jgi:hypothetical protein